MSAAESILRHLRSAPAPATIAELVAATGLHENAVRRNLATMVDAGTVHAERVPGSGRGRPPLRYRATGEADTPYRELMPLLLSLLGGSSVGREAAFEAGRAHGRAAAPDGDARDAVVSSLASMGFAPTEETSTSPADATTSIRLLTCPFADLVIKPGGRQLCALHHGILAGVAEARGGEVMRFDVVDPNVADCVLHLVPDGPGDQEAGGTAPNARAATRKASPRSS